MSVLPPRYSGLILTVCIVMFCAAPLAARYGENPPPPPFHGPGMPPPDGPDHIPMEPGMHFDNTEHMKKNLGLSDQQIEAIGRINRNYHNRMVGLRKKMAPELDRLKNLLREENVDRAGLRKALQTIGSMQTEMRYQMILQRLDIEKILTPEQRKKLREERRRPPRPDGDGIDD